MMSYEEILERLKNTLTGDRFAHTMGVVDASESLALRYGCDVNKARIAALSEAAYRALGLSVYARFDFILDEKSGDFVCLEANTLPGMTPASLIPQEAAAAGISYPELVTKIIELSLKKE